MQLPILLFLLVSTICVSAITEQFSGYPRDCNGKPNDFKIADPTDCTAYFLCHQDMLPHYCPSGTKFDQDQQKCIIGKCPTCDSDCSTCSIPTPSPPTPSPPTPPAEETPDCQFVPNGTLLPHSVHCRLFWQCVNLQAVLRFCEIGMWYDRTRYVCNYPVLVNCPANQD